MDANQQRPESWDAIIRPRKGWFDIDIKGLIRYRDLIFLMVKRNFTVLYKQTILGPAWVIIQPLLTTLVFTVVFGNIAGLPTDGVPKFLFYMAGNIMWHFFSQCLTTTANTFVANSKLFGKVYFPRLVMPFATVFTEMINFAVQFILFIVFVAYFGYMILSGAFHDLILHMGKCPGILLHNEELLQGENLLFGNLSDGEFLFWLILLWTWLILIMAYLVQLFQRYSVSIDIRKNSHDDS